MRERVREVYAGARAWVQEQLEKWAADARAAGCAARTVVRTGVAYQGTSPRRRTSGPISSCSAPTGAAGSTGPSSAASPTG